MCKSNELDELISEHEHLHKCNMSFGQFAGILEKQLLTAINLENLVVRPFLNNLESFYCGKHNVVIMYLIGVSMMHKAGCVHVFSKET